MTRDQYRSLYRIQLYITLIWTVSCGAWAVSRTGGAAPWIGLGLAIVGGFATAIPLVTTRKDDA